MKNIKNIMTLGKRIKAMRIEARFTQKELAQEIGCTQVLISNYEKDRQEPPLRKLRQLQAFAHKYKIKIKLIQTGDF